MSKKINQLIIKKLALLVGEDNISFEKEVLIKHAKDMSFYEPVSPDIVIWPKNSEEVSKILQIANQYSIPVTAWGGGSSLEGNPIPVSGGIVLDMKKMDNVIQVMPDDLEVRVQPGIIGEKLDEYLSHYKLWFSQAPGSKHLATVGGMIANGSGGMHTVKYGVVGDAVLELEVVLANGEIIRVGSKSFKTSSGYDLKRLFIGSEGTLGIITEAVLKLRPIPEAKIAVLATFPTNARAAQTNLALLNSTVNPASIEIMDHKYIALVNKAKDVSLPELPTLLIELHGNKEILLIQLKQVKNICELNNVNTFQEYTSPEQLLLLWQYRRAVRPALSKLLPNMGVLSAEVGVPVSRVSNLLEKSDQLSKEYKMQTIMFGHMADGNIHSWAIYELNNKIQWKKVTALNEDLVKYALSLGGTTTGEHGLGFGKSKFLPIEHPTSISLMRKVKKDFDPKGILNPGKIFPKGLF